MYWVYVNLFFMLLVCRRSYIMLCRLFLMFFFSYSIKTVCTACLITYYNYMYAAVCLLSNIPPPPRQYLFVSFPDVVTVSTLDAEAGVSGEDESSWDSESSGLPACG